ncbi:carbonic anhydrase 1-like [Aplysia californica]|uniref:carbonic anhydrase n=1 Tax=Aplysia californica TaxID=6500 RepID=A0ABM1W3U3_APLCA|nr:carbonic anhydrase 1-like [Aplysia californica]
MPRSIVKYLEYNEPSGASQIRVISRDPNFLSSYLKGAVRSSHQAPPTYRQAPLTYAQAPLAYSPPESAYPLAQSRYAQPGAVLQKNLVLSATASDQWDYDDMSGGTSLGPTQWSQVYPTCGEPFQSPVDITGSAISFHPLDPISLSLTGNGVNSVRIQNTGSSVSLESLTENVLIGGGNLPGTFAVAGIHFHWSRTDSMGSEHRLEGKAYPIEVSESRLFCCKVNNGV